MAKTLDRTRPFGESFGGSGPERFHQDDTWFDALGNEVGGAPKASKKTTKNAPADTEADDQVNQQMGA